MLFVPLYFPDGQALNFQKAFGFLNLGLGKFYFEIIHLLGKCSPHRSMVLNFDFIWRTIPTMHLEQLITHFGYPALLLGLLLEGETVLVLAAFMAHRGYLDLPVVILLGGLVAFASDQFFFWMGRIQGNTFLANRPAWQPHVEKAKALLDRNSTLLFLSVRFMYGLRTVLPFVLGMSKLNTKKFVLLDFIGAFLWAITFGLAGHFIGHVMTLIFDDVKEHELPVMIGIALIGIGIWLYRRNNNKDKDGKYHE